MFKDILYVASTGDNAIFAIKNAAKTENDVGKGKAVVQDPQHLHGPLGLVLAPNGDLIASNGDAVNPDPNHPNELVEFTTKGKFVGQFQLDKGAAGVVASRILELPDTTAQVVVKDPWAALYDIARFVLVEVQLQGVEELCRVGDQFRVEEHGALERPVPQCPLAEAVDGVDGRLVEIA